MDSLAEVNEDNSEKEAKRFEACLTEFCSPLRGTFDEELYRHICTNVRVMAADGSVAERRALQRIIQRTCVNVCMLIRDMAHAARIAAKGPMHGDEEFEAVWEELFNKKHALVPDIQNSDKYNAICHVLRSTTCACQAGLTALLRLTSFCNICHSRSSALIVSLRQQLNFV